MSKSRGKSCFAWGGIHREWLCLLSLCVSVNERPRAEFLSALERPTVISPAGRTLFPVTVTSHWSGVVPPWGQQAGYHGSTAGTPTPVALFVHRKLRGDERIALCSPPTCVFFLRFGLCSLSSSHISPLQSPSFCLVLCFYVYIGSGSSLR